MPSYTVTTNQKEEQVLAYALAEENRLRATQSLPPLPVQQFVRLIFDRALTPLQAGFRQSRRREVAERYDAAAPGIQQQVETVLGL